MGNCCSKHEAEDDQVHIDLGKNASEAAPARVKQKNMPMRPIHNRKVTIKKNDSHFIHVMLVEATHLIAADLNGLSDPYAVLKLMGQKHTSNVKPKTLGPVWNEYFTFSVNDVDLVQDKGLEILLFDHDNLKIDDPIGKVTIPLNQLGDSTPVCGWFKIKDNEENDAQFGSVYVVIIRERIPEEEAADMKKDVTYEFTSESAQDRMRLLHAADSKRELQNHDFSIFVGSWNAGNAPPPSDLSPWLPKVHDLIVIGAQEADYKAREGYDNCSDDWKASLSTHFGSDYLLVGSSELMQIRILVFARKEIYPFIHSVKTHHEATGIGRVVGNKGGTCVAIHIFDTSFCFVNSHLAAHQDKTSMRNLDVSEIISGLDVGNEKIDILSQFNHVIWMGDLNYRLNYGDQGQDKSPSEELFNSMVERIKNDQHLTELLPADQLNDERKKRNVFLDFNEGDIAFKPTFKVKRNEHMEYTSQRSPAWCDRILWKSILCDRAPLSLMAYESVPEIMTSDHKPIRAIFTATCQDVQASYDSTIHFAKIQFIGELKCENLPKSNINGSSDPYVTFKGTMLESSDCKTSFQEKNVNPVWTDVPELMLAIVNRDRLRKDMLIFRVKDHDVGAITNSLLGTAYLPLNEIIDGEPHDFDLELRAGGLPAGRIKGQLKIIYSRYINTASEIASAKKLAHRLTLNAKSI